MDGLVTDGGFSLTLTNKILEVLLKALLALQEAHGYIIICVTVAQLWEECPKSNCGEINPLKVTLNLTVFYNIFQKGECSPGMEYNCFFY